MKRERWAGRVVFLTGASSGLGEAIARRIGAQGAKVALFARRGDRLAALAAEIEGAGGRALALPGDVARREDVEPAVRRTESELGPVDVAIANAGVGEPTPATAFDSATVARILEINAIGAAHVAGACLPSMLARRSGHLVAIASLAGFRGLPASAAYCASKSAMRTLFESLRLDLHGTGVRVSTISPGYVDTPMTRGNRYPMPFLMTLDAGALRILKAIERGRRDDAFPWPLSAAARLLGHLPVGLYDLLTPILRGARASGRR